MSGSSFPELLYRFIAHYKWEPQHLVGSIKEFEERIKRQEPPLNFLLNAFLRFSSPATIESLLGASGLSCSELSPETLELKFPSETKFTQPDVLVESNVARIFIEVKVDSKIKLEQVQKYALLHATMNTQEKKRPYLLFLTKHQFPKWWSPSRDIVSTEDVNSFVQNRLVAAEGLEFLKSSPGEVILREYDEVKRSITFGALTWSSFGHQLVTLSAALTKGAGSIVERRVVDDFVSDLRQRGFIE